MDFKELEKYYSGKKVLITGHTGFKGSWLSAVLIMCKAEVFGYAKSPADDTPLFDVVFGAGAGAESRKDLPLFGDKELSMRESRIGDIRDFESLKSFYDSLRPDYVFHLAAQPIVRDSYRIPRETYETNVMGTVNLLECIRLTPCPISVLNVTTDKVYLNEERSDYAYREEDKLDGYDPYSNSKSCSELATHSYRASFFEGGGPAISTARAGNVIGGGDMAKDRIIPDCVRAAMKGEKIFIRNPLSIRPYQHVLEPLSVYLEICARAGEDRSLAGWYNVGPDEKDCITTGKLAELFCRYWGEGLCAEFGKVSSGPHEANFLKLDSSKIKETFSWKPRWEASRAVENTVRWSKAFMEGKACANAEMERQIREFFGR